jgi:hypothetical protein
MYRLRQLSYMRRLLGLRRKTSIAPNELDRLVELKKKHIAFTMGIRRLMYYLRREDHIWVTRESVHAALASVDADGLAQRRKNSLHRRLFYSDGPDQLWSCDGFDKLEHWGFPIHGGMDVYSRYLVWLRVGISNNDPRSVLAYYLDGIEEQMHSNVAARGILAICIILLI